MIPPSVNPLIPQVLAIVGDKPLALLDSIRHVTCSLVLTAVLSEGVPFRRQNLLLPCDLSTNSAFDILKQPIRTTEKLSPGKASGPRILKFPSGVGVFLR